MKRGLTCTLIFALLFTFMAMIPAARSGQTLANLIFIHHSVGEAWLNDGLSQALNDKGFHVADIYYGWKEYGDRTDTSDWPMWFTNDVMEQVYWELDTMTAQNSIPPVAGENTIVIFKSCYPNSDVGSSIADEQDIYDSLIPYFQSRPGKMFVLITPPPMITIEYPARTRELCDWLTDKSTGWLAGLETGNVFVFDLYNVLTHPNAHHRMENGEETHVSMRGFDTLHYDSSGDDHPNQQGNIKAAGEFIGLLDYWFGMFLAQSGL